MAVREVPLDAARDPRPGHADQAGLDRRLPVEPRVPVRLVLRPVHAAADLRQHQHLHVLVLEERERLVGLVDLAVASACRSACRGRSGPCGAGNSGCTAGGADLPGRDRQRLLAHRDLRARRPRRGARAGQRERRGAGSCGSIMTPPGAQSSLEASAFASALAPVSTSVATITVLPGGVVERGGQHEARRRRRPTRRFAAYSGRKRAVRAARRGTRTSAWPGAAPSGCLAARTRGARRARRWPRPRSTARPVDGLEARTSASPGTQARAHRVGAAVRLAGARVHDDRRARQAHDHVAARPSRPAGAGVARDTVGAVARAGLELAVEHRDDVGVAEAIARDERAAQRPAGGVGHRHRRPHAGVREHALEERRGTLRRPAGRARRRSGRAAGSGRRSSPGADATHDRRRRRRPMRSSGLAGRRLELRLEREEAGEASASRPHAAPSAVTATAPPLARLGPRRASAGGPARSRTARRARPLARQFRCSSRSPAGPSASSTPPFSTKARSARASAVGQRERVGQHEHAPALEAVRLHVLGRDEVGREAQVLQRADPAVARAGEVALRPARARPRRRSARAGRGRRPRARTASSSGWRRRPTRAPPPSAACRCPRSAAPGRPRRGRGRERENVRSGLTIDGLQKRFGKRTPLSAADQTSCFTAAPLRP